MQRVAQARLAETSGVVLVMTTEVLLNKQGPLTPIWLQCMPKRSQAAQLGSTLRQCAFAQAGKGDQASLHMLSPMTLLEFATTSTGTRIIPSSFGERLLQLRLLCRQRQHYLCRSTVAPQ